MCFLKKRINILITVLFVYISAMVLNISVSADSQNQYTALGDSIAAGYGLQNPDDGYAGLLSAELDLTLQNLSLPGMNSGQLIEKIQNLQGKELEDLKSAKLITVSIGSNDILGPFLNMFSSFGMYGGSYDIDALYENSESISEIADELKDAGLEDILSPYVDVFKNNLPLITEEIKKINSSAELIFTDFYNPFKNLELPQTDFGIDIITDELICMLNDVLYSENKGDYSVAGVYELFEKAYSEGNNPVNVSVLSSAFSFDPHPNAYGHSLIKDAVLEVLPEKKTNESEAETAVVNIISQNTEQIQQKERQQQTEQKQEQEQKQSPETGLVSLTSVASVLITALGTILIIKGNKRK